jgi:hypothetical protein
VGGAGGARGDPALNGDRIRETGFDAGARSLSALAFCRRWFKTSRTEDELAVAGFDAVGSPGRV